ncbi:hypothetical protein CJ030_MR7G027330 [Morella rubra]|uniref:O-fucosyltransferase family protein n=1 Tax=Morella rubra TaxID=262757 RepID=A0A6A1V8Y6_9ROSI|nr:hypothetical protein CJ030_MR7G027330 [Morella rubra]
MEDRSEEIQLRCDKLPAPVIPRTRLQVWFIRVCSSIVLWTCLVQLVAVGELWHPRLLAGITNRISRVAQVHVEEVQSPPPLLPARKYTSNGFLRVSCNGGLNQMRAAICDMVTIARLLNLTLVVPELDKASFWADPSNFEDIFDVRHFIDSLRDEVRIIKRLPKRFNRKHGVIPLEMPPVSWSNEKYYLQQLELRYAFIMFVCICGSSNDYCVKTISIHYRQAKVVRLSTSNKVWTSIVRKREAKLEDIDSSMIDHDPMAFIQLQILPLFGKYKALKFTPQIETLGYKLVHMLQEKGPFVALHLRYEMDMLAFSGCTHGCTEEEAEELKRMRYAYPWWREKEIVSEERRSQGLCPLTPEEMVLVLQALGFDKDTQIYIAAGEIYGSERRLEALRAAFPRTVKKEMLLAPEELQQFQNHSSQMAALDFMVSVASNTFVPTYDGNMAKVVEGHRRYLGFKRTIQLDRKRLVELLDMHQNRTLAWNEFVVAVGLAHKKRMGQPTSRKVVVDKPKEEDYFYANPQECLCEGTN